MAVADKDSQKRMIGEYLKSADRLIKSSEFQKALEEVGKALALEPNNMYAMAYKDRINASIVELNKKKSEGEKAPKPQEEKKNENSAELQKAEPKAEVKTDSKIEQKAEPKQEVPIPPKETSSEGKAETKNETPAKAKEEPSGRIESLRQEFSATQAKLQRDVALLTMQLKEAQSLKESQEKNLNQKIVSLTNEVYEMRKNSGGGNAKELEALKKELSEVKEKHQKELDLAKAESLAQIAQLQKELETAKTGSGAISIKGQGEALIEAVFQKAWQDGTISNDERALLLVMKAAIEMTEGKFTEMESGTKNEAYINALRGVWKDSVVTPEESDFLNSLREKLGISAEEHFKLESQIRKELQKK
ncbi:MAG: hypothetical protein H3C35_10550 [Bacteroidetes bacterium]|nr:hypothetical protein [Bacteroidota bacterium]